MKDSVLKKLAALGILADNEAVHEILKTPEPLKFCEHLESKLPPETTIVTADLVRTIKSKEQVVENGVNRELSLAAQERGEETQLTSSRMEPTPSKEAELSVRLLRNYDKSNSRATIENFSSYFNDRYEKLRTQLAKRPDMQNTVSMMHAKSGERASLIGMVRDKRVTPNKHRVIGIEDPTGSISAIVMKDKVELVKKADDVVFDEVIGITGAVRDDVIFVEDIIWPDIPTNSNGQKRADTPVAAAFLSDIHIGSTKFMENEFMRFIDWLNGKSGNSEQRETARKIAYILIAGDVVDGIGIYPGQEDELSILDIHGQFEKTAELLSQIPEHIKIILGPGNHDAVRLAQPQPPLTNRFTDSLSSLENLILVSNPAVVSLHGLDGREGTNVLMYHGVSYDGLVEQVPSLRNGYKQPELVLKDLLKRRHLSPIHGMDIAPEQKDNLVVDLVPDIIHAGHVHVNGTGTYRGVRLINSGAWQSQTSFQKMLNHEPTPCRVPILDLQTDQLKIINFA